MPYAVVAGIGYAISIQKRKHNDQGFGLAKMVGRICKAMVRGLKRVYQVFVLIMTVHNHTRMRSLGQMRPKMAYLEIIRVSQCEGKR